MLTDVRQVLRGLARSPAFATIAVLTLGLGIGAETAIYSVVRGVLLRPLDYPHPEALVTVCETHPRVEGFCVASPGTVEAAREQAAGLTALGFGRSWPMQWSRDQGTLGLQGGLATPDLFHGLGVRPARGRLLRQADLASGAPPVAVLSHELWRDEMGSRNDALGESIELDGVVHRVVGVLPEGTEVPRLEGVDLWTPPPFPLQDPDRRGWRGFVALGRLADGVSLDEAATELSTIQARLAADHPESHDGWGVRVEGLHDHMVGGVRPTLLLFLGAVGLVLLVATVNVAHLILARATVRHRELAVRTALGASRRRLVGSAFLEGATLSLAGCAVGLLLAMAGVQAFLELEPAGFPRLDQVRLDGGVLLFAMLLGLVGSVVFAALPGIGVSDRRLGGLLRAMSVSDTPAGTRFRNFLVVAEVAMAVTLLAGAGLLTRSFVNLLTWDPGFERSGLATLQVFSSPARYPEDDDVLRAHERAAVEVAALPGVRSVGLASAGPIFGGRETATARTDDMSDADPGTPVRWYDVGPRYFETLGVPLVRGRGITPEDRSGQTPVALVNQTAARRLWPEGDPVGESLRLDLLDEPMTVVGVVRDVPPIRAGDPVEAEVYWPYAQRPRWGVFLVMRFDGAPGDLARPVRERLEALDPDMQLGRLATLEELAGQELRRPRFTLTLVAAFALVAALLVAVGIYGLLAYAVARRTRELGIRMAVGADGRRIERSVVLGALRTTSLGLAVGFVGAALAARSLSSLLHGVTPLDPWTLGAVTVLVLAISVLASWVPARRASAVDLVRALRET